MNKNIIISIKYLILSILLFGFAYTFFITGIGYVFFKNKVTGSIIESNSSIVGSKLIGQKFSDPKFFFPRPSAGDYGTLPSSASNYGVTSSELKKDVDSRIKELGKDAPCELLFASGSGLDPDISLEGAMFQVDRISKERQLSSSDKAKLIAIVQKHIEQPQFKFLGSTRVNVLELNMDIKKVFDGK
jgi:potassium-transporting ATPase KdpC subunit